VVGETGGSGDGGGEPVAPAAAAAAACTAAQVTEGGATGGTADNNEALLRELTRRNAELVEMQRARDEMASRFIHDMRSPMMVISANLEFAISTAGISTQERDEALSDSHQAAAMLSRLIESLLHVTRLHSGRYVPRKSQTRAAALLGPLCARSRVMAAPHQVTLETGALPEAALSVDVPLVSHALEVLADHVLERTPPGGTMRLTCVAEGAGLCIRLGSTAPSMPAEDRDQLFDRLGGAAIPGGKTKVGAGLYLCRLVTEAHGGRFTLEESADLPTCFVFALGGG
jgi:K+-sensing histidine kinase KdpD